VDAAIVPGRPSDRLSLPSRSPEQQGQEAFEDGRLEWPALQARTIPKMGVVPLGGWRAVLIPPPPPLGGRLPLSGIPSRPGSINCASGAISQRWSLQPDRPGPLACPRWKEGRPTVLPLLSTAEDDRRRFEDWPPSWPGGGGWPLPWARNLLWIGFRPGPGANRQRTRPA